MNRWLRLLVLAGLMVLKGALLLHASSLDRGADAQLCARVDAQEREEGTSIEDSSLAYHNCASLCEHTVYGQSLTKYTQKQLRNLRLYLHQGRLMSHCHRRRRMWIPPTEYEPSCKYYVFALRRLLC